MIEFKAMYSLIKELGSRFDQFRVHVSKYWIFAMFVLVTLLCLVNFIVFEPGFYTYDSIEQLSQALGKAGVSNWHPVTFVLIWKWFIEVIGYGGFMLLLQLGLLWAGLLVLSVTAYKITNSKKLSALVLGIGLLPYVYTASSALLKDVHLAHALLLAVALIVYGYHLKITDRNKLTYRKRLMILSLSMVCLTYAALMRHGPAVAFFPIVLILASLVSNTRKAKYFLFTVLAALLLLTPGLVDGIVPGEKVNLGYSVLVDDFVYVASVEDIKNSTLKKPHKDYLLRVKAGCPIGSPRISGSILHCKEKQKKTYYQAYKNFATSDEDGSVKRLWIRIIAKHPIKYLRYRTVTFSKLLFAETADVPWRPAVVPNSLGLSRPDNIILNLLRNIYKFALQNFGFGFRGWFWLSLNLAVLSFAFLRRKKLAYYPLIAAVTTSGILYALQFFPAVMAYGYRYLYWVTLSGILSAVLLVLDVNKSKRSDSEPKKTRRKAIAVRQ